MKLKFLRENKYFGFVFKIIDAFLRYDIGSLAAELTFYLITTFFPLIILIFIIISHTPLTDERFIWNILSNLPYETADVVYSMLKSLTQTKTIIFTVVILSMWSMSGATNVIAKALNRFYRVHENRNIIVIRVIGMLFAIFIVFSVLISFVLLVYGSLIEKAIVMITPILHINFWKSLSLLIPLGVITIVLAMVYKIMPNRYLKFKHVILGALFAAMCWGLSSMIFSYYANNFARYHVLYGSIAGVIMLVTWLFMSSYVILLGGYLNAMLYKHIAKKRKEQEIKDGNILRQQCDN